MEGKSPTGVLAVSLGTLAFWKRKSEQADPSKDEELPPLASQQYVRTISQSDAQKAREELKLLEVERQILGSALTTIYESQTKGLLSGKERDYLLGKYKSELKRLEEKITERQRLVDLFELEESREKIAQSFRLKLAEIEAKIEKLRPEALLENPIVAVPASYPIVEHVEPTSARTPEPTVTEPPKDPEVKEEEPKTKAEKRLEAIREEVLKAMERLEEIEAEG